MTGRWSCVVLVLALAACRTPQKNVSVFSLADDEAGSARYLHNGSDVGETVTGRMNLPNYADTETTTNSTVATVPVADSLSSGTISPTNAELSAAGKLPVTSAAQKEAIHLKPAGLTVQPTQTNGVVGLGDLNSSHTPAPADRQLSASVNLPVKAAGNLSGAQTETIHLMPGGRLPSAVSTNTTANLDVSGRRSPQNGMPVSQPIHLNLSAWTNSSARETASLAYINDGHATASAQRSPSTSVNVPVHVADNAPAAPDMARTVAVPEVGAAAPSTEDASSKPVDLAPLLDDAHDEAWRQRQADRQRAAENARQSERDSLEKTLQQFLQPRSK